MRLVAFVVGMRNVIGRSRCELERIGCTDLIGSVQARSRCLTGRDTLSSVTRLTKEPVDGLPWAYVLYVAGFAPPSSFKVTFEANKKVRELVEAAANEGSEGDEGAERVSLKDPSYGLTLDEAVEWFMACRAANKKAPLPSSTPGKPWLDDDTKAILNMMANKNEKDTFIRGYKVLADARRYHSPRRREEVGDEIYKHLLNGKIVILDLSVGDPTLRERISKQIAQDIFVKSMQTFIEGRTPPNVVVYIEEAHNLIGKKMDLTETWPRLAKEGAKYRIALVYATQEVSSVHPNILANTENWFISHLNNEDEVKALGKFYDFNDFSRSLIRAQDVGFARVKTLSSPFVVPVQIDKFSPPQAIGRGQTVAPQSPAPPTPAGWPAGLPPPPRKSGTKPPPPPPPKSNSAPPSASAAEDDLPF